jgi:hypothetical protein
MRLSGLRVTYRWCLPIKEKLSQSRKDRQERNIILLVAMVYVFARKLSAFIV